MNVLKFRNVIVAPDLGGASILSTTFKSCSSISDELYSAVAPAERSPQAYTEDSGSLVDFIVRGEGETTFRELLRAVETKCGHENFRFGLSRGRAFSRHSPGEKGSHRSPVPPSKLKQQLRKAYARSQTL